jgi:predicted acylesterase/phospholipase RssA
VTLIPIQLRRPREQPQPPTAFALSGGARLGAIQAGMLRALPSNARLQVDPERDRSELDLIVLPAANPGQVQPTDFSHARELLDAAYQAVSQMLQDEFTLPCRGADDDSLIDDDRADVRWLGRLPERWTPTRAIPRNRRAVAGAALPEQDRDRPQLSTMPGGTVTPLSERSHPPG